MVACRAKIPWVLSGYVRVRPKPADPSFHWGAGWPSGLNLWPLSASALQARVRLLSDSACVEGALWQRSQFTRSVGQLHYNGGALCVTVYGSMQGKDPVGAFRLCKSKARASWPGFPFCLCLTQSHVQIKGRKTQPTTKVQISTSGRQERFGSSMKLKYI